MTRKQDDKPCERCGGTGRLPRLGRGSIPCRCVLRKQRRPSVESLSVEASVAFIRAIQDEYMPLFRRSSGE